MADGKHPTPGMPDPGGPADRAQRGSGEADGLIPRDERGAGGGGPTGPKTGGKPFRGGQSEAAYHGPGQLGEEPVDDRASPNAASREN